jgi:hypothetical protein
MMAMLNKKYFGTSVDIEWLYIKISFILFWFITFYFSIINSHQIPLPVGICTLVNLNWILYPIIKIIVIIFTLIFCILYLFEYKMRWICFFLFIISLISFSIEESNGLYNRNTLLSLILFVQFISYLKEQSNLHNSSALQYSIQVIAGAYTLSAISKLCDAGLFWVVDGKRITLQILKSHFQEYSDYVNNSFLLKGDILVKFIENHTFLLYIVLSVSLILELFALVTLTNKKITLIYGILLLFMHLGIYIIMDILILPIILPMIIFMINPLFHAFKLVTAIHHRLRIINHTVNSL